MKDTFDLYSIDSDDRAEIIAGIWKDTTMNSLAGRLFGAGTEVRSLVGSLPYIPSKTTMNTDTTHAGSRVALGAKPNSTHGDLASAAYEFTHKYAMKGSVLKHNVFNLSQINSPELLLDLILKMSMGQIALDIDKDLRALLVSTSDNEAIAATAAWSNNTTARPITDIEAMYDKAAGAYDTVVIGEDKVRALAKLDTFKTMTQNYTAATSALDTRANKMAVVQFLFAELGGVQNIVIGDTWYDTSGIVGTLTLGRLFDGVVWMGAKEHLQMLKVSALDEGDQGYDGETQKFWAYQNVHAKFVRLEKIMGCVLTGS